MNRRLQYLEYLRMQYTKQMNQIESILNKKIQHNHLELNNVYKLFDNLSSPEILANFSAEQRNSIELMKKGIEDKKKADFSGCFDDKESKTEDEDNFENENKSIPESSNLCNSYELNSACKMYDIVSSHELLNFKDGQKKNIELGKNQFEDKKDICSVDYIHDWQSRSQDRVSLANSSKDISSNCIQDKIEEINKLKEAKDTLECQIKTVQNEAAEYVNDKRNELYAKSCEFEILKQRLSLSNKVKRYLIKKCAKNSVKYKGLHSCNKVTSLQEVSGMKNTEVDNLSSENASSSGTLNVAEARIISILSIFLHKHQDGASIEYICIFLNQMNISLTAEDVINLMRHFPTIFQERILTVGSNVLKRWFNVSLC